MRKACRVLGSVPWTPSSAWPRRRSQYWPEDNPDFLVIMQKKAPLARTRPSSSSSSDHILWSGDPRLAATPHGFRLRATSWRFSRQLRPRAPPSCTQTLVPSVLTSTTSSMSLDLLYFNRYIQ